MEAIPSELAGAALAARGRLSALASSAAGANAKPGSPASQLAMASAAREAIFADALLSAMHARLEEIRSVIK